MLLLAGVNPNASSRELADDLPGFVRYFAIGAPDAQAEYHRVLQYQCIYSVQQYNYYFVAVSQVYIMRSGLYICGQKDALYRDSRLHNKT